VIARSVHPEYREVLGTYATAPGDPAEDSFVCDSVGIDLKGT